MLVCEQITNLENSLTSTGHRGSPQAQKPMSMIQILSTNKLDKITKCQKSRQNRGTWIRRVLILKIVIVLVRPLGNIRGDLIYSNSSIKYRLFKK